MHPRLWLAALAVLFVPGCSNTLNPFCGSSRPAPMIGSLSPTSLNFSQVQQGATLTVNGSQFVAASEVQINGTALSTTVVNSTQLKVTLTTGIISAPESVKVNVLTPSGNSADLGCSSGGQSSVLLLKIN